MYGLGEQYTSIEHTGRESTNHNGRTRRRKREATDFKLPQSSYLKVRAHWWTTYSAISHYVTSKARSFFLTNYTYSEFDFTEENAISVHMVAPTGMVCGQIIAARDIPGVLQSYTEYSGRIKPLPEWAMQASS